MAAPRRLATLLALLVAVLVVDAPALPVAQAHAWEASRATMQAEWLAGALEASLVPGLTLTRVEDDGSVTLLGLLEDQPGPTTRREVAAIPALAGAPGASAGLFTRTWTGPSGQPVTTVGAYAVEEGQTRNVNLAVLEGVADLDALLEDALRRDVLPVALNSAPFLMNYAMPTSLVLLLAIMLGAGVLVMALASAGFGPQAALVAEVSPYLALAPVFGFNVLFPYHVDARQGEVYRDWPETYVWHAIKATPAGGLWSGHYLNRTGSHLEETRAGADGAVMRHAEAHKRDVVGPVLRQDARTTKLPGVYLRQDVVRDFATLPDGSQRFDARQDLTAGAYDDAVGETPGANVRMEETKEGSQTFAYAPHQADTLSVGVMTAGGYVPLLGTRTESRHRPYADVTNLGATVAAIESHRVTSVGAFVQDAYVPVFGADYWGERNPTDLWALAFALGAGLGDQAAGDVMVRAGAFVDGRFVAVAGARLDDDFAGHRHAYRSMLSAGLFVADPRDPGAPVPGESPDGARFVPLAAATYDGVRGSTPWALANAADDPAGMGPFLVSAGLVAGDRARYLPLVGAEHAPGAHRGHRAAQETYRVGVFPADYAVFIPLAGATYDGEHTSAAQAAATALGATGGGREGAFETTQGAYVLGGYVPLTGLHYRPDGTASHGHGHTFTAGYHDASGAFVPVGVVTLAFAGAPAGVTDACQAQVRATLAPTGHAQAASLPCGVATLPR